MGKVGLLIPGNFGAINQVCEKLSNKEHLHKSRIHPLNVLSALNVYASGSSVRGDGEWDVVGDVVDVLNDAFYDSFQNVEPSGQRVCIAIDISGSMKGNRIVVGYRKTGFKNYKQPIYGMETTRCASAMAMVLYKVEKMATCLVFNEGAASIDISRQQRLDNVVSKVDNLIQGGTDCSAPIRWAEEKNVNFDAFVILTDGETWFGGIHPKQALDRYRKRINPKAKLAMVNMTANDVTIADPTDPNMTDLIGFDTAVPQMITQFLKGEI